MKTRSKNLTKKMLSILLSAAMGVSSFAMVETPIEVKAEESTESTELTEKHVHCVCGETHKDVGDHTTEEEVEWTAWTPTEETPLPTTEGNYYLTQDVEITSPWDPINYTCGHMKFCLNGHTITYKSTEENEDAIYRSVISIIHAPLGGKGFVLSDCKGTGKITGGRNGSASYGAGGGGIASVNAADVKMFGGIITGNEASNGGGVHAYPFTMYGGTIEENTASRGGGGVYARGNFTMYGGTIKNNTAQAGGGIYGGNDQDKDIRVYGGSIEGNTASLGGGITNIIGTDSNETNIYLYDGASITGNTATSAGGGVAIVRTSIQYGYQNFRAPFLNVEGKVIVDGNIAAGEKEDILVTSTVLDSSTSENVNYDYPVTLTGPLAEGSKMGIKATPGLNFTSGWGTHMKDANPDDYFVSTVPNHHVERIGDELQLRRDDLGYKIEITKDLEGGLLVGGKDTLSVEASITGDGTDQSQLKYQWYRTNVRKEFEAIADATASTYAITADEMLDSNQKACERSYYCQVYKEGDIENATRTRTGKYTIKAHDKVILADEIKIFIDNSQLLNQKYSDLEPAFTVPEDAVYDVKLIYIKGKLPSETPNQLLTPGEYGSTYLGLSAPEGYDFAYIDNKTPVFEPARSADFGSAYFNSSIVREGYKDYITITLNVADMLQIREQPTDLQVYEGYSKPLSVVTNITEDVSYQWYQCDDKDKTNPREVSGATAATLEVPADLPIGTYYYYCKVNDSEVKLVSDVATVTVKEVARIKDITDKVAIWKLTENYHKIQGIESEEGFTWGYILYKKDESKTLEEAIQETKKLFADGLIGEFETEQAANADYYGSYAINYKFGSDYVDNYDYAAVVKLKDNSYVYEAAVLPLSKEISEFPVLDSGTVKVSYEDTFKALVDGEALPTLDSNSFGFSGAFTDEKTVTDVECRRTPYWLYREKGDESSWVSPNNTHEVNMATNEYAVVLEFKIEDGYFAREEGADIKDKLITTVGGIEVVYTYVYWYDNPHDTVQVYIAIGDAPEIIEQPQNTTAKNGDTATFSVKATGAVEGNYQWQVDKNDGNGFVDIEGAVSAAYTTDALNLECDGFMYQCVITNILGTVTTEQVKLTVKEREPEITTQPQAVSVKEGEKATFSVEAAGKDIKYQWQVKKNDGNDFVNIEGATSATYTTDAVSMDNNGFEYRCVLENVGGTTTTEAAVLTVTEEIAEIKVQPKGTAVMAGKTATFTVETSGNGISYQWQVDKNDGNDFVNIEGATAATYTTAETNKDYDGFKYRCVVTNTGGSVTTEAAVLHVHSLTQVPKAEANCTKDGCEAYYKCAGCEDIFADEEGKNTTTLEDLKIDRLGHDMAEATCTEPSKCKREGCNYTEGSSVGHKLGELQKDENNHWKECSCGYKETEAHKCVWYIETEATDTVKGKMHGVCETCGQKVEKETPVTDETSGSGKVEVISPDTNANSAKINNPEDAQKYIPLTEDERAEIVSGEDLDIILEVTDITETVKKEDKEKVEAKMDTYKLGMYMDVSLWKKVGKRNKEYVSKASDKILIMFMMPENLRAGKGKERTYKVMRLHDGVVTVIDTNMNTTTGEISFETDSFSVYALVYEESVKVTETPSVTPTGAPTEAPSVTPTGAPSATPTEAPSATPTEAPSVTPTEAPSATPTEAPSATPTEVPSVTNAVKQVLLPQVSKKSKNSIKISWNKIDGATGYEVYATTCGNYDYKLTKTVKSNKKSNCTITKVKGKKVANKNYKFRVKAYKLVDGKKVYIAKSKDIHLIKSYKKYGNAKAVTVKKEKVTLNVGKTSKISASIKMPKGKKQISTHGAEIRYISSDENVAKVSSTGKIKAVGKGKCKIYVLAINGNYKAVSVTVK